MRAGLAAAVLWILIEFAIRDGVLLAIVAPTLFSGKHLALGHLMRVNLVLLWPAMLVLGLVFLRLSRREGLSWNALGYRPWRSAVLPGLLAAIVAWGLSFGTEAATTFLFATAEADSFIEGLKAAGLPFLLAALLPANGILGPVVEEFAWRGYIQTKLNRGWGPRSGIVVTALLFAFKHVVVDVSYYRIIGLVVGGFTYGLVRYRWGTSASTILHVLGNSAATVDLILAIRYP